MLKKFKELFTSESHLDGAFGTTIKMLELDRKMFDAARRSLRESDSASLDFDVKRMDRRVNKLEREVRRNILTHLTVTGSANLVPGLALASIVIDVERIGDYTKNMVDMAERHPGKLHGGAFEDSLRRIEQDVTEHFEQSIPILKTQDVSLGRSIMRSETDISRACDDILYSLLAVRDQLFTVGDAVAVALYSRHLKRINSHITNVASAIVNPFPRISFREKRPRK